jgi:hypothetical protein
VGGCEIVPTAPVALHPSTMALHYAGDLRGAQGLPAAGRRRRIVQTGRECAALRRLCPTPHARSANMRPALRKQPRLPVSTRQQPVKIRAACRVPASVLSWKRSPFAQTIDRVDSRRIPLPGWLSREKRRSPVDSHGNTRLKSVMWNHHTSRFPNSYVRQ